MEVDRGYAMCSYLMYRYVVDAKRGFSKRHPVQQVSLDFPRRMICSSDELLAVLQSLVAEVCQDGKAALALSGGMDSAILAKLMPQGSTAYTFRCIVPGIDVVDESPAAAKFAEQCGLQHKIIPITWDDVTAAADLLMLHKGAPIHSIECQIYLAACKAKQEGMDRLIFGENADIIYGGMDGLLAKDWTYQEFVDRYSYILPYYVLRAPKMIVEPFLQFEKNGHVDSHAFINTYFRQEALGTYTNACKAAGITFVGPYAMTCMGVPLDYQRVRSGDTKYWIREIFRKLYPGWEIPAKLPMPRPVAEWLRDWEGPVRKEFIPHCADKMSGNQRWMIWALERFLNLLEEEEQNVPSSH